MKKVLNNGLDTLRHTLPKSAILRGLRDFRRLFSQSSVLREPHLHLRFRVNEDPDLGQKVAFIARRTLGGAVVRNRIKRQMRESYRQLQHGLFPALNARFAQSRHDSSATQRSDSDTAHRDSFPALPDSSASKRVSNAPHNPSLPPSIHIAFIAQTADVSLPVLRLEMERLIERLKTSKHLWTGTRSLVSA